MIKTLINKIYCHGNLYFFLSKINIFRNLNRPHGLSSRGNSSERFGRWKKGLRFRFGLKKFFNNSRRKKIYYFNYAINTYFEHFNPISDFGSLYDSSYYSEHGLFSSTSTTTSTMSVSSTPFEVSTVMYEGEIVNCLTRPIRCYEIREREEANSHTVTQTPKTENSKIDTTTKYWVTTDQSVIIDWVSLILFFFQKFFFLYFF